MNEAAASVLVADDDPEILQIVRRLLLGKGLNVLAAADGDEAMEKVLAHRPDLVILDVMMPGQTGWEVCRAIREVEDLLARAHSPSAASSISASVRNCETASISSTS